MGASSTQEERRAELREVVAGEGGAKAIVVVGAGVSFGAAGRAEALWDGLLRHGVEHCLKVIPGLDAGFRTRQLDAIASGHLDELLGVARLVTRKLGDRSDSRYRNWLAEAVGGLKPGKPEVLEALGNLGLPLATTNYDTLLEQVTGRASVTWRDAAEMLRSLNQGGRSIAHLHGLFSRPESVVLDEPSYLAVIGSEGAQALQQGMALFHSLVFVGCGAGLADPNFGGLLAWLREHFSDSDHRHYRLCREREIEELERQHAGDRIAVVAYGPGHEDLAAFLRDLKPPAGKAAGERRPPGGPPAPSPARGPDALGAYRAWAVERFGHLEMIGVGAGELKLDLSQIYVPLRLEQRSPDLEGDHRAGGKAGPLTGGELGEAAGDLELGQIFRRLPPGAASAVILGEPGSGKTTALRRLLHLGLTEPPEKLGVAPGTVPVFLRLRRLSRADVQAGDGHGRLELGAWIEREITEQAPELGLAGLGELLWRRGNLLLLLDGLDEVADEGLRREVWDYLLWGLLGEEARGVRAVVSCRLASWSPAFRLDGGFASFEVRPLDGLQVEGLVRRWFREVERTSPSLAALGLMEKAEGLVRALSSPTYAVQQIQRLVGSPLLATLLCVVVLRGGEIPRRRTGFYQACLEVLLRRWGKAQDRPEPLLPLELGLALLRPLAFKLHREQRRDDLSKVELVGFLRRRLRELGRAETPAEVLGWLVRETGVVIAVPPYQYAFAQLGFQEYLTALHAAEERGEALSHVASQSAESWWREVIEMVAGVSGRQAFRELATELLRGPCLEADPVLLRTCLEEACEVDLDPFLAELAADGPPARQAAVLRLLKGRRDPDLLQRATALLASADATVRGLAAQLLAEAERAGADETAAACACLVLAPVSEEGAARALAEHLRSAGGGVRRAEADGSWQAELDLLEVETRGVVLVAGAPPPWEGREERELLAQLAEAGCRFVIVGTERAAPWPRELPEAPRLEMEEALTGEALARLLGMAAVRAAAVAPSARGPVVGEPFSEERTGIRFLWVPAGRIKPEVEGPPPKARSVREVEIAGFWLAQTPVTNRQYAEFLDSAGHGEPAYWRDKRFSSPEQPVVGVSWEDAVAFCRWLAGQAKLDMDLPSEAQWEYAARGPEGRTYPWGDEKPGKSRACFGRDFQKGAPAAVGSYPAGAGPFGHLDQAGNVWEWCEDEVELPWAKGEAGRVLKGGGCHDPAEYLRSAFRYRSHARGRGGHVGFRVAVSPPSP